MSEAMARAVGAEGSLTVEIAGKSCTVRPLSIRELAEVERCCVKCFRRSFLSTYAENLDLVPKDIRKSMMQDKFDEAARWDIDDLPLKHAFDPEQVHLTDELRAFIVDEYGTEKKEKDKVFKRMVATALDQGTLSVKQYRSLTGKTMRKVKIAYASWWITASMEGMITFVWTAFKHNGVTREQVEKALSDNPTLLSEFAREIERLSAPQLGNG